MKNLAAVLAVAVLATGGVAVKLWRDLQAEHGRAAELATRVAAAESKRSAQAAAPSPIEAAIAAAASAQPLNAEAPPAQVSAPPVPQSAPAAAGSPMKQMLDAMNTPEMRAMMRSSVAQMYPDIEQVLGLTAQEKTRLLDLLAEEGMESAGLMFDGPQDPAARREMQRKVVEADAAHDAKVSALLGNRYPKWEEYQGTTAARQEVDSLQRTLRNSGSPLSETQATQLVSAFAAEKTRSARELRQWSRSSAAINSPDLMQETVQRTVESQNRLVGVAAPILGPEQLDRYKRQVERETTMLRATMSMMGAGGQP